MSLLVDSLKDRLLLAVPKKGRLHEKCVELLSGESAVQDEKQLSYLRCPTCSLQACSMWFVLINRG